MIQNLNGVGLDHIVAKVCVRKYHPHYLRFQFISQRGNALNHAQTDLFVQTNDERHCTDDIDGLSINLSPLGFYVPPTIFLDGPAFRIVTER